MTDLIFSYNAKVDAGKLTGFNRKRFEQELPYFEGKHVTISIRRKKKSRSNQQNAYFHGVVLPIVTTALREAGHDFDLEDTKMLLKVKFLKKEFISKETGLIIEGVGKTRALTTTEFMDFLRRIQQWVNEFLGIVIPEPEEQTKLNF